MRHAITSASTALFVLAKLALSAEPTVLLQTSFESDPTEGRLWSFGTGRGSKGVWDTSTARTGKACLKILGNPGGQWASWSHSKRFPVTPGERLRLSAHIRTQNARWGIPRIDAGWYDSRLRSIGRATSEPVYATEWTKSEGVVTAPRNARHMRISCSTHGCPGTVWFDDLKAERLPKPGVIAKVKVDAPERTFRLGSEPEVTLVVQNPVAAERRLGLIYSLEDWREREIQHKHLSVLIGPGADWEQVLKLSALGETRGYYRVRLGVAEDGLELATAMQGFSVLPPMPRDLGAYDPGSSIAANIMGATRRMSKLNDGELKAELGKMKWAGVNYLRLWQPWRGKNEEEARQFSPLLSRICALAKGLGIKASVVLYRTAEYAKSPDPKYPYLNTDAYARWVGAAVEHYTQWTDTFEIDNEPRPSQDYLDRLKAGYCALKRTRPQATAIHAGLYWNHRMRHPGIYTFGGTLFNAFGILARDYAERVNWHEYYGGPPEVPFTRDLARHRAIADRYLHGSYGRSFFHTETAWGAIPSAAAPSRYVSYRRQAEYAARLYLIAMLEQSRDVANRSFWYYFWDAQAAPYFGWTSTGVREINGEPKPSYLALVTLYEVLRDAVPVGRLEPAEHVWAVVLRKATEPIVALWSAQGEQEISLDVGRPRVSVVDTMGNRSDVATPGGELKLTVNAGPTYVIGCGPQLSWRALAARTSRIAEELLSQVTSESDAPVRQRLKPLAERCRALVQGAALGEAPVDSLRQAEDAVTAYVDWLIGEAAAKRVLLEKACALTNALRLADVLGEAEVLLGQRSPRSGELRSLREAHAKVKQQLGVWMGCARARAFLRLAARRLDRAERVAAAEARVLLRRAARDLHFAKRFREIEERYRLSVWLSAYPYGLEIGSGETGSAVVTVHNEEASPVECRLTVAGPPGWRATAPKTAVSVPARGKVEVAIEATAPGGSSLRDEPLFVRATVDDAPLTPVAIGVRSVSTVKLAVRAGRARTQVGDVIEVVLTGQPKPNTVLGLEGRGWAFTPRYVRCAGSATFRVTKAPVPVPDKVTLRAICIQEGSSVSQALSPQIVSRTPKARPSVEASIGVRMGNWLVCGPFPNPQESAMTAPFPDMGHTIDFLTDRGGEAKLIPAAGLAHRSEVAPGGSVRWRELSSATTFIDFEEVLGKLDYRTAYAYCAIHSDRDAIAVSEMGSDDGIKVWVNHELVWDNPVRRGAAPASDRAVVRLRRGLNHCMAKVYDGFGDWQLHLAVQVPTEQKGQ